MREDGDESTQTVRPKKSRKAVGGVRRPRKVQKEDGDERTQTARAKKSLKEVGGVRRPKKCTGWENTRCQGSRKR